MNKNLLITLLLFGSIEVTSQANSDDTLLICESGAKLWFGVSLNADTEQVSYLEFGEKFIVPTNNWEKASDIYFGLKDISFSRKTGHNTWDLRINRESLRAEARIWYYTALTSVGKNLKCSFVEDKDLFQSKVDEEIRKYELAQQLEQLQKKQEEERKRLAKEAQKKKNKI